MENLKVRVNNEAESEEVQGLFFELGGRWVSRGKAYNDMVNIGDYIFLTDCNMLNYGLGIGKEELTIPQLRDLVVLKRNSIDDATHTDQDGWKWYIGADSYVWQAGNSQQLKQWDQSSLATVDLKPIKEKEMKEFLVNHDNKWTLQLLDSDTEENSFRVAVPSGADWAYKNTRGQIITMSGEIGDSFVRDLVWQRNKEEVMKEFLVNHDNKWTLQLLDADTEENSYRVAVPCGADFCLGYRDSLTFYSFEKGIFEKGEWVYIEKPHRLLKCKGMVNVLWNRQETKEFLNSKAGYVLQVLPAHAGDDPESGLIEVPEKSVAFVKTKGVFKGVFIYNFVYDMSLVGDSEILWQRHTQPEELPLIDDEPRENIHYFINVSDLKEIDFYEIAKRYKVTDPAIQHILKKCLAIGNRGYKDLETDLKDILKTAKRALEINGIK